MDKTVFLQFFSLAVCAAVISAVFPDGKYRNILKMLLSAVVVITVFSWFSSGFSDMFDGFPTATRQYDEPSEDGLKKIIVEMAENDAEKMLSEKFGIAVDEISFSAVLYEDNYYLESVSVCFPSVPETRGKIKAAFSERYGIPEINVFLTEGIKEK